MNAKQIRQTFLEYFNKHNHEVVASSSLIPAQDPTLLFANAGMNQFKDCFLGKEKRSYTRATTSQKCVRAGGKHNDLEQVGFTARHLTFFEMLGNFSFGDYFKKEAITFAWDLLTNGYKLPSEKLYITVFREDDDAYDLWHTTIGIPQERLSRLDEGDNFWSMGDTGPCGPCTEIYLDQGSEIGCDSENCAPGCDCDRFIEIWNLVFMQYNRGSDGTLEPLQQTGVDTGMGFERLACVMQNKKNIFHSDVFAELRDEIEQITGKKYFKSDLQTQAAFNVICDHIRSASLIIADGGAPSNEGRGYVLRKIIRRGILFAHKLSESDDVLPRLARRFASSESDVFPELKTNQSLLISIIEQEVSRFSQNLISGKSILERYLLETKEASRSELSGAHAFKLYDTYGFPLELTKVIAGEHNISIDEVGYEKHMAAQQEQSKKKATSPESDNIPFPQDYITKFIGYDATECDTTIVWEHTDKNVRWIITEQCPFYVESGGQVNDDGVVTINDHSYHVVDLKKVGARFTPGIAIKLQPVETMGPCSPGDTALCQVDKHARMNTVRNHTATHMLHAALHELLGPQAKQAGSVVNKDYLRFDFTHHEGLSYEQIKTLEDRVNEKIWENISTNVFNTTLAKAQEAGVNAFFGEKYNPESVRVVAISEFSKELCGGTHAARTGEIGCFKIISEAALATGVRRIFAVTGPRALESYQNTFRDMKALADQFKARLDEVVPAVVKQGETLQLAQSTIKATKKQLAAASVATLKEQIDTSTGVPHLVLTVADADSETLRTIAATLANEKPVFYFIAANDTAAGKSQFLACTSTEMLETLPHKEVMEYLRSHHLRGGGKPGTIQGGGPVISEEMITSIVEWIKKKAA